MQRTFLRLARPHYSRAAFSTSLPVLSGSTDRQQALCSRGFPRRVAPICLANGESRSRASLLEYVSTRTSGSDLDIQRMTKLLEGNSMGVLDVWLLFAARVGDSSTVRHLLSEGANVNIADSEGSTALMRSISRGHADVAEVLLDAPGVDLSLQNNWGYDAVMYAGSVRSSKPQAYTRIRALLEARGADLSRI